MLILNEVINKVKGLLNEGWAGIITNEDGSKAFRCLHGKSEIHIPVDDIIKFTDSYGRPFHRPIKKFLNRHFYYKYDNFYGKMFQIRTSLNFGKYIKSANWAVDNIIRKPHLWNIDTAGTAREWYEIRKFLTKFSDYEYSTVNSKKAVLRLSDHSIYLYIDENDEQDQKLLQDNNLLISIVIPNADGSSSDVQDVHENNGNIKEYINGKNFTYDIYKIEGLVSAFRSGKATMKNIEQILGIQPKEPIKQSKPIEEPKVELPQKPIETPKQETPQKPIESPNENMSQKENFTASFIKEEMLEYIGQHQGEELPTLAEWIRILVNKRDLKSPKMGYYYFSKYGDYFVGLYKSTKRGSPKKGIKEWITKSELNEILLEGINSNNVLDMTFISYGTNEYDTTKFKEVDFDRTNRRCINKPIGGLWASPIDSKWGWIDWCSSEDVATNSLTSHFMFKLSKDAKIYVIDNIDDLKKVSNKLNYNGEYGINFEELYDNGYDGIFVTKNAVFELRNLRYMHINDISDLYSWDVESLCVFNEKVIIPIPEDEFDKMKTNLDSYYKKAKNYNVYDDEYGAYSSTLSQKDLDDEYDGYMYDLDRNRNINPDMSKEFRGLHPGILAQGDDDNELTQLARKYNGTLRSGI